MRNTGCHAWMIMTWLPICLCSLLYALTDRLIVAAHCLITHRRIAISSHLLLGLRRLAASSLTECQGHSRRSQHAELLTEGCSLVSGRCSSSTHIAPKIRSKGPRTTHEQDVDLRCRPPTDNDDSCY